MLTKTRAIVLRTFKYGDNKLIVDLLTEQEGRISCIVTRPKTPYGRSKKQLYQPMSLINVEVDLRPKSHLHHIRNVSLTEAYLNIPFNNYKLPTALFLAEFLYYATRGEQQNPHLFQFVATSLQWFDAAQIPVPNFHLIFIVQLSQYIGFYPNLDNYQQGCRFDLRSATFCTTTPLHPDYVGADEAAVLPLLIRLRYPTMHLFRLSHEQRNRILHLLLTYYRLHVPSFPELRSTAIIQELFA